MAAGQGAVGYPEFAPALRPEVRLLPGPKQPDGAPTYVLHDPLRDTFEGVDWRQREALVLLGRGRRFADWAAAVARGVPGGVPVMALRQLIADLRAKGLLRESNAPASSAPPPSAPPRRLHPLVWLLTHYLYLRLPLVRPDRWLGAALPWVAWLGHRATLVPLTVMGALAALVVLQRWETRGTDLMALLSGRDLLAYGLALTCVKCLHELGHAFAAKSLGCRVRSMGLAFMVLWPVPYTDVTDAWRLPRRGDWLRISAAGIAAEMGVASLALVGWVLMPPGWPRGLCVLLFTTTLISTLLTNLNPAMRFDGYYLLADALGIDNLQARGRSYARWWIHRFLLGVPRANPEPALERWRRAGLLVYAGYAAVYRVFLYFALAAVVYYTRAKILGVVFFATAVALFFVAPALREARFLVHQRSCIAWRGRAGLVVGFALLLLLWVALPLPRRVAVPAVTLPTVRRVVAAPISGYLQRVAVERGAQVIPSTVVVTIGTPELERERAILAHELVAAEVEWIEAGMAGPKRPLRGALGAARLRMRAELAQLDERISLGTVRAGIPGTVTEWDPAYAPGVAVLRNQRLGAVGGPRARRVLLYLPEGIAPGISADTGATFIASGGHGRYHGRIQRVERVRAERLREPSLGVPQGGPIRLETPPRGTDHADGAKGHQRIAESYFAGEMIIESGTSPRSGQTGWVWLWTSPRSYLAEALRHAYGVLLRESGF